MAKLYGITIEDSGGVVFTATCEGVPLQRYELDYKGASEPNELQVMREVWTINGARIRNATDGAAWTSWFSFISALTRDDFPLTLKFTLDPSGTPTTLREVGPSTHVRWRILSAETVRAPELGGDEGRKVVTCNLVISAELLFVDASGVVRWNQTVRTEDQGNGLRRLVREAHVETEEGEDAAALAASLNAWDLSTLGSNWTRGTNTSAGADTTELDADSPNSRVATIADVTSVALEWGVVVSTGSGTRPNAVALEVRVESSKEEIVTTTVASATGPGYLDWVRRQKPAGTLTSTDERDFQERKAATFTWVRKQSAQATPESLWQIECKLVGGGKSGQWLEMSGDAEPIWLEGGRLAFRVTVKVTVERRGANLTRADLLLPGQLPSEFILDRTASEESDISREGFGVSTPDDLHSRTATYVYGLASAPSKSVVELVQATTPVETVLEVE